MHVPSIDDIKVKSEVETNKTVHLLMFIFFILAAIGVPVSIRRSLYTGWLPIYTFQIGSFVLFTLLLLFRNKLSLVLKINCITCISLSISIGGLILYGLFGNGVLWSLFTLYLLMQFYAKHTVATVAAFLLAVFGVSFTMFSVLEAPFPGDMQEFFVMVPSWGATLISAIAFSVAVLAISRLQRIQRKEMLEKVEKHSEEITKTITVLNDIMNIDHDLRGDEYLKKFVKRVSETLSIKYVLIGHLVEGSKSEETESPKRVETDVFWNGNSIVDNISYDLVGTPCETIFENYRVCAFSKGVAEHFPDNAFLQNNGIESYIGAPMLNERGELRAIIALMDSKPHINAELLTAYMDFFSARIGVELQRSYLEKELKLRV